jgi:hypothetical protein
MQNRTVSPEWEVPHFGAVCGKLKKLVVKGSDFPYQFPQMHRVGAGGKPFLPQSVVYKKRVPKTIKLTLEEPNEV